MACVAVNSLVRTIELEFLQPLPRPILRQSKLIPANKNLIQNLHQKLGDLIELFDENRMDGIQAIKELETKLRDVAFRVEDEIEFLIVDLYETEEKEELLAGIAGLFVDEEEEEEELLAAIASLFVEIPESSIDAVEEEEDLGIAADVFVEKPEYAHRSWHSFKLGCILEEAIRDIDAIHKEKMEYERVKASMGRKGSTLAAASTRCDGVVMMGGSSQHVSHSQPRSQDKMVGKNNEFQIVKEMLIEHSSRPREIVSIQGMGGIGKTTLARRVYEDSSIAFHFDKQAWVVASQIHNKLQMLTDLLKSIGCAVDSATEEDSATKEDRLAHLLYQTLLHQRYFVVIDDIWSVDAWDSIKACFPYNENASRVLLTTRFARVATSISSNNDFSHQAQFLDESESWNLFREKASKSSYAEFEAIGRPIVEKYKGLPLAIVVAAGLFSKLHTLDEWKNVAEALNSCASTTIDEECSRIFSSSYNHLPHSLKACFLYLSVFREDEEINVNEIVKLWVAEGFIKTYEDMSFDEVARRHIQELKERNLILVKQPSICGSKVKTFGMHDSVHSFCVREAKKENLLHVLYENESSSPPKYFRWLSIQPTMFFTLTLNSSFRSCRSIFSYGRYIRLHLKFGSLLRVLYGIQCDEAAYFVVHLRSLLSSPSIIAIPDPFCSWNLQALSAYKIDKMRFLEFPQLQYLRSYRGLRGFPIFFHQNLKSICGLLPNQCTKELFTNIPYLKKVKILCKDDLVDCINSVAYAHQLQTLHLRSADFDFEPAVITNINRLVCLKNLMSLRVTHLGFEWKAINILSELPKLKVLRLRGCLGCIGEEWELLEKENFDQLIYLEIALTYLKHWEASACHFPNLRHLVLKGCLELVEIPADFADIAELKSIKLDCCLPSVVDSAKEIQKEQHDYGNDNMVVIEEDTIVDGYSLSCSNWGVEINLKSKTKCVGCGRLWLRRSVSRARETATGKGRRRRARQGQAATGEAGAARSEGGEAEARSETAIGEGRGSDR